MKEISNVDEGFDLYEAKAMAIGEDTEVNETENPIR